MGVYERWEVKGLEGLGVDSIRDLLVRIEGCMCCCRRTHACHTEAGRGLNTAGC